MGYTLDEIIEKVNALGNEYGLTDLEIEDGEDLYFFIRFLDDNASDLIKENKELTEENIRLKSELDKYRRGGK